MQGIPAVELEAVFGPGAIESVELLRPRPLGATVGVWRVRVGGRSAVLKLLRLGASPNVNWAASDDPTHPRWWRREAAAFDHRLPDLLRPELRPPSLLHAADRHDGSLALWLEDLGEPAAWTVDAIASVAHLLGVAQARVARRPPAAVRGFLRAYLEPRRPHLEEPFAASANALLDRLDSLPQTLCHFDLHPANVFPLDDGTAVIDWAYCSLGPLGADAGVLASDALVGGLVPAAEAEALVGAVWEAYRDGVGDAPTADRAAEAYALGTALRYSWLPAWLAGRYGPQPEEHGRAGAAAAHEAFRRLALAYL